jgi:hypothetical protein
LRIGIPSGLGLVCIAATLLTQCRSAKDGTPSAVVVKEHVLSSISSGSGLVSFKDSAYIISDDAPFLGRIALKNQRLQRIAINGLTLFDKRIPQNLKPDYEAALTGPLDGRDYLFAFGSGSISPERDSLLFFPVDRPTEQHKVSLTPFYQRIQQLLYKPEAQWNLEGATKASDSLVLFNRGNNTIMNVSWNQFVAFVQGVASEFPFVSYRRVRLPQLQGHEARFSGACTVNDEYLLASASVEDTPNWTEDGPVLGSFLVLLDRKTYEVKAAQQLTTTQGKPYVHKLESVEVLEQQDNGTLLVAGLVDDDDGKTRLIRIRFAGVL